MTPKSNIQEIRAKMVVQKALAEICELVTKAVDVALDVKMSREHFETALKRFTDAMWVE